MEELDEMKLALELIDWVKANGVGRNESDLRFGQYIWSKYDLKKIFPAPDSSSDGFSVEKPSEAFHQIMNGLMQRK